MYEIKVRRRSGEALLGTIREPVPVFGSEIQLLAGDESITVQVVKMSQYPSQTCMIDRIEAIEL